MTALERLFQLRLLESPEAVKAFDAALAEIEVTETTAPALLRCFDDRTRQPEVMWGLVHALETLSDVALVSCVLHASEALSQTAQEWLELLVLGQLNHPACRAIFLAAFHESPTAVKSALEPALRAIARSTAAGADAASRLLASR